MLERFPQQFQYCAFVLSFLHQNIGNLAFLVDGAPHEHPDAVYSDYHFVEMSDRICASALAANVGCDGWSELVGPASERLVRAVNAPFGQQIFDVP